MTRAAGTAGPWAAAAAWAVWAAWAAAIRIKVTRYDPISIWENDMGDRFGRSDINEISIWDVHMA
jgi:hypothetical protein